MTWRQKKILEFMMFGQQSFDYLVDIIDTSIDLILYYGDAKKIKVPRKYQGLEIKEINPSVYTTNERIIEVKIPEGIEVIY